MHILSVIGIFLILIGTGLLHWGNGMRAKNSNNKLQAKLDNQEDLLNNQIVLSNNLQQENSRLTSLVERLQYPIPDIFYVDLTLDITNTKTDSFLSSKIAIMDSIIQSEIPIPEEQIDNIHRLTTKPYGEDRNSHILEIQEYFKNEFGKLFIDINIYSETDNKFISMRNKIEIESFTGEYNTSNIPPKKPVATIAYLFKDKIFSIYLKNLPIHVVNKDPQMRSYLDFENTTLRLNIHGFTTKSIQVDNETINYDNFKNKLHFDVNRFILNDKNLLLVQLIQFQYENSSFRAQITKLTEWNNE